MKFGLNMNRKVKLAVVTFAGMRLGYGTGHLIESLSLANEWRPAERPEIKFFINDFSYAVQQVRSRGFSFEVYTKSSYADRPFKKIPRLITDWGYDVILVNVPVLFKEEIKWLASTISPMVVILDDDQNQFFQVSALINYNINQDPAFYASQKTPCYVGINYVPLNRKKLEQAKSSNSGKFRRGDIVITFGGTDPNQLALRVLQALFVLNPQSHISLVLGGGSPQSIYKEISSWLKGHPMLCNTYYDLPQEEFYQLLAVSSFAISAPGNTLYELCFLGIPTAAIAENEATLRVAEKFAQNRWCTNLGLGINLPVNDLVPSLGKFLHNNRRPKAPPLDGRGIDRIIDIVKGVIESKKESIKIS